MYRRLIVLALVLIWASPLWAANAYISAFPAASSVGSTDTFPDCAANGCNSSTPTKSVTAPLLSGGLQINPCTAIALADGASVSIALNSTCNLFSWAPGASGHTLAAPSGVTVGEIIDILISQPGSGGPYTVAWNAAYESASGGTFSPTLNTGANAVTEIACKVVAATPTLYCYGPLNGAYSQTSFTTPTAPSSTSAYALQGLAGSITPTVTGNVIVYFEGTIVNTAGTAATIGINYQLYYGTGSAPGNAQAVTGSCGTTSCTAVGQIYRQQPGGTTVAGDPHNPIYMTYILTGLSAGTTYWLDIAAESIGTASDVAFQNGYIGAYELR